MRFSTLTLLGLVVFAAIGCAALLNSNQWWASILYMASVLSLLTAVLASIYSHAGKRAFWTGFALFGTGYFLLVWKESRSEDAIELPTTLSLIYFLKTEHLSSKVLNLSSNYRPTSAIAYKAMDFLRTGHSLFTLLFGLLGGLIAQHFYSLRQKQNAHAAEHPQQVS